MSETIVLSQRRPYRRLALGKLAVGAVIGLILSFLVLPTLIVILISFGNAPYIEFLPSGLTLKWYGQYFSDPDWMAATLFSLRIAFFTTISGRSSEPWPRLP